MQETQALLNEGASRTHQVGARHLRHLSDDHEVGSEKGRGPVSHAEESSSRPMTGSLGIKGGSLPQISIRGVDRLRLSNAQPAAAGGPQESVHLTPRAFHAGSTVALRNVQTQGQNKRSLRPGHLEAFSSSDQDASG